LLLYIKAQLIKNEVEFAESEPELILCHCTQISKTELICNLKSEIAANIYDSVTEILYKRIKHIPLAKIIGYKHFWNSSFFVNEHVLDPRPETEILVESAIEYINNIQYSQNSRDVTILDLGTGSGCIIISLLQEFQNAHGVAVDISQDALKVAQHNADKLGIYNHCAKTQLSKRDRLTFIQSDWFSDLHQNTLSRKETEFLKYDLIVANPPYVGTNSYINGGAQHDPALALYGGKDGLKHYREIFRDCYEFLKMNGCVIVEYGYDQKNAVEQLARQYELIVDKSYNDLSGHNRVTRFVIASKDFHAL
jgi:release factor glutamine methyltransferase